MTSPAACLVALLSLLPMASQAHDSWFAEQLPARSDDIRLTLGTGTQFPKHETSVGAGALIHHGCRRGQGARAPLRIVRELEHALVLRSRPLAPRASGPTAVTCWTQMPTFDVQVAPDKVDLYLDEVNASPALRQTWAEMRSRGVAWNERYTKHARIELLPVREAGPSGAATFQPSPMGMDIVLQGPRVQPKAGEEIHFVVTRDGQPLPGQPIELRNDRLALGLWVRTDEQGQARVRLPFAANFMLRGVDLRVSAESSDRWDSRFVTLAFSAGSAAR